MNHSFEIIPLTVEARGEIITNNLPEFRELVREALGNINRDLKTDEEFEQAEKDIKALKFAEDSVRSAAVKAFDDQLKALVDGLNETAEEIRVPRLELEKLIAKRKEEVKAELIAQALDKIECAPRLRQGVYGKSIAEAIKGKRTLDSMAKALEITVAIHNGSILKNRKAIESFCNAHGAGLVPDSEALETQSPDSVEAELRRRFEANKAAEERKRLEAEAAQAKAEAQAAIREAEAAKAPPMKGMLPPSNLPTPPKIGSIPTTGFRSAAPSNVVPMTTAAAPATITEDEEWKEMSATVKAAFALIKEHRERLVHESNKQRIASFGASVNAVWAGLKKQEVAS